ncbi:membrane protein [Bacteroidia bacterium]|nr:membrane protein [Bacteroidia bacterium]GHT81413.1 membrane protein [Bacteroidia bacterium]
MKTIRHYSLAGCIAFGLLIIAAGVLLLMFNAGALPLAYKPIVFSWQMLMIAFGFVNLFSFRKRIPAIVLILLGSFLLLPKLNIDELAFLRGNGWAVFLIVIGVLFLLHLIFAHCSRGHHCHHFHTHNRSRHRGFSVIDDNGSGSGYIDRSYVFNGSKEKIDYKNFKGGEINCVFGGFELDLSDAQLAEGKNVLEINAVFGGITIFVPAHWKVEIAQTQALGGFVDKRPQPSFEVNDNCTLIITGSAVLGGGEIRCKEAQPA